MTAICFGLDDFFLRMEQRTPERLREVGGNVDYERFGGDGLKTASSERAGMLSAIQLSEMGTAKSISNPL